MLMVMMLIAAVNFAGPAAVAAPAVDLVVADAAATPDSEETAEEAVISNLYFDENKVQIPDFDVRIESLPD